MKFHPSRSNAKCPADTWTKDELVKATNKILRTHKQPALKAENWVIARAAYENVVRFYSRYGGI